MQEHDHAPTDDLRSRVERAYERQRIEGLTITGDSVGVYYDGTNPFRAELRADFNDGETTSTVAVALATDDLLSLMDQCQEVLAAQNVETQDFPPDTQPSPSAPPPSADVSAPATGDAVDQADDPEEDDPDRLPLRERGGKMTDPMNLRNFLQFPQVNNSTQMARWLAVFAVIIVVMLIALLI